MAATVYDKVSGASRVVSESAIVLEPPSVVVLPYGREEVASFRREGLDLVIRLHSGETVRIANYYVKSADGVSNDLVLQDDDGTLWLGQHSDGLADFQFAEIQSVDQLIGGGNDF